VPLRLIEEFIGSTAMIKVIDISAKECRGVIYNA
jgi:hypothetical protein